MPTSTTKNKMELKNYNVYFFFLILIGTSIVTYYIMQPFLISIIMGGILAVIFQRPFKFFLSITGGRRISALATSLFGIFLFVGLFSIIVGLVVREATPLFQEVSGTQNIYERYVNPIVKSVESNHLLKAIGLETLINKEAITKSIGQVGQGLFSVLQNTYQGVAHFLFLVIVVFFTLYYLLVGGRDLINKMLFLSPLRNAHEKILIQRFISISRATVKGTLVVGIVQGTIGGFMLAFAGVPSAGVWGIVMMFLSLIPMFGSSLVWFPAGIILLLMGNIWQGFMVLGVGLGVISTIDNFLRPKLVGKDTQMHPLVIFFSTLGGISLFGFLGFIIGPIIVALFITLWDIYAVEFKTQLKKYNK